jgi:hypothetical protein
MIMITIMNSFMMISNQIIMLHAKLFSHSSIVNVLNGVELDMKDLKRKELTLNQKKLI